jgi:cystathionine beta-lyase/cystathionine gamma-synthase
MHPATVAVQVTTPPLPHSRSISVPIYQASNFAFDDPDALAESLERPDYEFVYSRYSNPTTRALENTIAQLERGTAAIATASGMGAINAMLLSLLRTGDHVIAQNCLYGGTYATLKDFEERFGIAVTFVSGTDPAEVTAALRPSTKVLYLETIANPMTRVTDLPAFTAVAKQAGLITVVDNTFASPIFCRPIEHGVDIVLHSATKYLGGHNDVTGGVLVFADLSTYQRVWHHAIEVGVNADPFAAWLMLRGIQTLPLRMRQHHENAATLADRLAGHPAVTAVHWPGRADHPDRAVAERLLDGYGGVLAFDLEGGREAGFSLSKRIRLIHLAASLGGVTSNLMHPASTSHRQLDEEALRAAGIGPGTVRLSVGIEHVDDLWADLEQAL